MHPDVLGWAATAVLMATLIRQMVKQWQSSHPEAGGGGPGDGVAPPRPTPGSSTLLIVNACCLKV